MRRCWLETSSRNTYPTRNVSLRFSLCCFLSKLQCLTGQISQFLIPSKIREGMGEMSTSKRRRSTSRWNFKVSMCCFFRKKRVKGNWSRNRNQILHFLTPVKFMERIAKRLNKFYKFSLGAILWHTVAGAPPRFVTDVNNKGRQQNRRAYRHTWSAALRKAEGYWGRFTAASTTRRRT